jgi:hypothetical protein
MGGRYQKRSKEGCFNENQNIQYQDLTPKTDPENMRKPHPTRMLALATDGSGGWLIWSIS